MAQQETTEIDWDDPEAVAAARGDNVEEEEEAEDGVQETETSDEKKPDEEEEVTTDAEEASGEEDEAPAEEEKSAKGKMIPKSRYDSKAKENKRLQDELDRLRKEKLTEDRVAKADAVRGDIETELSNMDKLINQAIADDDMDEAARIRAQQRQLEREMWQLDMNETSAATSERAREQVRLDLTIDNIEASYPELNPDSDSYSQDLVDTIQELRVGFEATGKYSPTQALLRAMDFVLPQEEMTNVEEAANKADKQISKEEDRRKAALKKATDAANKQPANADGVGDDSDSAGLKDSIDVNKLSYEDIANLPEATLKRLRGDLG